MPERYRLWCQNVRTLAELTDPAPFMECAVEILLHEWRSNADLDNYGKSILDALTDVFWVDDCCRVIRSLSIRCALVDGKKGFTVRVT